MNRVKEGSGWEHLIEIARIEGFDGAYTWNPCVGCNNEDCEVRRRGKCWAMMLAKRFGWYFKPRLISERLKEPFKVRRPVVITPVSMGDLFGQKRNDIHTVLRVISECEWHRFAILTKMPQHALDFNPYPDNIWFGVTVNHQKDVWRVDLLRKIRAPRKYCLFEPLYGPINYDLSWLDLIVIGPQNYPTIQPEKEWVKSIIRQANGARIYLKSKLKETVRFTEAGGEFMGRLKGG